MFSGDCEDLLKLPSHAVVVNRVDQLWPVAGKGAMVLSGDI